jgi:REP element-mobilizing transposase RayT
MSDKFQNKYRIPSARLQTWDYGNNGSYFITICTQGREHYFGDIVGGEMQLNEIGKLAEQYWIEIPNHFPFIELGNFVVMPNHVHGILVIDKNEPETGSLIAPVPPVETPNLGVSTTPRITTPRTTNVPTKSQNGGKNEKWKPGTIGVIINQYKRICTINARKIHSDFAWQSRFHDHIIRDAESFERIQNYIADNPKNWKDDKFYS